MEDTLIVLPFVIWIVTFIIGSIQLAIFFMNKGLLVVFINILRSLGIWWYINED